MQYGVVYDKQFSVFIPLFHKKACLHTWCLPIRMPVFFHLGPRNVHYDVASLLMNSCFISFATTEGKDLLN